VARIRVGVAGCGSVSARHYLPDLAASPYVELVAVCDTDESRAVSVAGNNGVRQYYTDIDAMLAGADFELLCNLTPMREHGPIALKALRAGRHVLNEKPLAVNLHEADALLEEAARRGLVVTAAPNAVLSPTFRAAAAAIASGEIGKVCAARGRYGHSGPHEPWFYKSGGGALFDLGVYNVVTLTGLLGPAVGVVALSGIAVPRRTLHGEEFSVEADDNTTLLLDFGDGVQAVIQTGFVYPRRAKGGAGYDDRATIELLGTSGAINWLGYDWEPHGIELCTETSDSWETRAVDQHGYTWKNGGSALARSLALGERSAMTAEHAYHTLEVMLGALDSAATGRRVALHSTFPWPVLEPEDAMTSATAVNE
jgi:predicted dehydrogenase